jgi:hypothetical protein
MNGRSLRFGIGGLRGPDRFQRFLRRLPETRLMVHEPLAFGALDRFEHPLAIRHFPIVPAEPEFFAVAVQVLLAQLMENAVMAALDKAEEGFGGVRVNDRSVIVQAGILSNA